MALNLFKDILPSIMVSKKVVIQSELDQKDYSSFMVNRALSFHQDTIHQANQMNLLHDLPKIAQYQFLMGTVRQRKRPWFRWPSPVKNEDVELAMKFFGYSREKATEALKILNEEQVEELRKLYSNTK